VNKATGMPRSEVKVTCNPSCEGGKKTLTEIGRIHSKQGLICVEILCGLFSPHEFNGECLRMMYEERLVGKLSFSFMEQKPSPGIIPQLLKKFSAFIWY
jgi:hypothetical protein